MNTRVGILGKEKCGHRLEGREAASYVGVHLESSPSRGNNSHTQDSILVIQKQQGSWCDWNRYNGKVHWVDVSVLL